MIIILGGKTSDRRRSASVTMYDPLMKSMIMLPPMPKPLSGFAAVVVGASLYVIGGNDGKIT